tara:strand:+ start:6557 stop:6706 length:150 start_codon:yes stop_codon:yes gene_type:complete
VREMRQTILEQAVIGLVGVAIDHIDNGDTDKARETMLGIIISLEGQVEA